MYGVLPFNSCAQDFGSLVWGESNSPSPSYLTRSPLPVAVTTARITDVALVDQYNVQGSLDVGKSSPLLGTSQFPTAVGLTGRLLFRQYALLSKSKMEIYGGNRVY